MFKPGDVLVQKFGGSSMATPERIQKVAERIAEQALNGRPMAVVVSAMGDTTDDLIGLVRRISADVDPREMDQLMATGEMVSCSMMVTALRKLGVKARSYNAFNLHILTNDRFGSAEIRQFGEIQNLAEFIKPGGVAVVAGFQGITPAGDLTTLGRGGSDITAVALARELQQKVCEKFTDEDGVYTADPRMIPSAKKIWHLSYDEMETLARYGNGLLHPRSIAYAREAGIRIHVRSSFTHEEGSIIGPLGDPDLRYKSITCDKKQAVISMSGVNEIVPVTEIRKSFVDFSVMEFEEISRQPNRDLRIGFKVAEGFQAFLRIWDEAEKLNADDVKFHGGLVIISVVGCGLKKSREENLFVKALREAGIEVLLTDHSDLRFSVAVEENSFETALKTLHSAMLS